MQKFVEALSRQTGLSRLDKISWLQSKTSRIGIPNPSYIAVVLLLFSTIHLISEYGTIWISSAVGFAYPAYITLKLVKSHSDEKDEEGKFWLKYWLVYGMIYISEPWLIRLLTIIPHYYVIKTAFLVWLVHPESQGASMIYERIVREGFRACEPKIDERLEKVKKLFDLKEIIRETIMPMTREAAKKTMRYTSGALCNLMFTPPGIAATANLRECKAQ